MKSADHVRLQVLGPARLDGPGDDVAGVLSQSKRLAVLAYLAVHGGFVRRDALVTLFWPDLEAAAARRALSQAIHYLRRALGKEAIRTRGVEEIGVSPDHVWSDVRAFEAAIAGSRWDEALELYRGELLHGMNGSQTVEFAHWLDGTRTRFRRAAGAAAAQLSAARFRAGDIEAAIRWQRRAVEIQPLDEAILRGYLMLLDEAGNGAVALREFELFRARLAEVFALEPAVETVKLIGMIRSRRPDAAVAASGQSPPAERGPGAGAVWPSPAVRVAARERHRHRQWLIAAASAVAAVLIFLISPPLLGPDGSATPVFVPNRVAILHFKAVDEDSLDYLALGITNALTDYLHGFEALDIVPNHAVARFRHWDAPLDTIRSVLKAAFAVTGEVNGEGSRKQVNFQLIQTVTQKTLASRTVYFTRSDDRAIIDSVMVLVQNELAPVIGEQLERDRYEWGTKSGEAAAYALKAASLADRAEEYARQNDFDLAERALAGADSGLDRAIKRDGRWALPHILRARISWNKAFMCLMRGCDMDAYLRQGLRHAEMAINLDPQNAEAHELRADLVMKMWVFGRETDPAALDRAYADAESAILLDESRARAWSIQSEIAHERGDYERALSRGQTALRKDEFAADRNEILNRVFESAFHLGNDSIASEACEYLLQPVMSLRAAVCALQLRAWSPEWKPDVDEAWAIADALETSSEAASWEANRSTVHLLVAAVIAAAAKADPSLADSASHVIEREIQSTSPANTLLYSAAAMTRAGAEERALLHLREYVRLNPNSISYLNGLRWFKPLNEDGAGLPILLESSIQTASNFPKAPPHK